MEIRRAVAGDARLVSRLNRNVQRLHADALPGLFKSPTDDAFAPDAFAALVADPAVHLLIGTVGDSPVGYLYGQIIHYRENPFRSVLTYGLVDQLAVSPAFQRRGYGEQLLRASLAIFRDAGIARVELAVWAFNDSARHFFERQGFAVSQYRMSRERAEGPVRA